MRIHLQEKPQDPYIAVGRTVVTAAILPVSGTGNLLATLLVPFVPGYVLGAALFPWNKGIDLIKRTIRSSGRVSNSCSVSFTFSLR